MNPEVDAEEVKDFETTNLAEGMGKDELEKLGTHITNVVEEDLTSRGDWEKMNDEWMKLAAQVIEEKSYPWPKAANVKYPLLSTAALQFHARAYPALVNDQKLVKVRILGPTDGEKTARAQRVSSHMSYQLLEQMEEWQEDMDRLLYLLPIIGLAYKKTYFSLEKERNASPLVLPRDLIINYHATSFERAIKTHRMYKDSNEIYELMKSGIYLEVDLGEPETRPHEGVIDEVTGMNPTSGVEDDGTYEIYESHTWYDLDGDGYKEPVIVTVNKDDSTVLRVVPRYEEEDVQTDDDGNIVRITPTEYFTSYKFLPNPESNIYALGFGALLGPTNKAVNTILNQLIDAGTLSNLQGGFIGKGARIRGGSLQFSPGKWMAVQSTGDDLRKNIFPMPIREPSGTLFNLLNFLVESGERLSSVKDIMVGDNPGQNQPYATTVAVLEQGMKVFVGIYKRIYRSLTSEYKKLYKLNSIYMDSVEYYDLFDIPQEQAVQEQGKISINDYAEGIDVVPGADPNVMSDAHKQAKAQSLMEKLMAGLPLNPQLVLKKMLEAEGHDNIEELMQVEPPQPDPEQVREDKLAEHKMALEAADFNLRQGKDENESIKDYSVADLNTAKAEEVRNNIGRDDAELSHTMDKDQFDSATKRISAVKVDKKEEKPKEK